MSQKRLKTLNLCDRSVEHLKTKHEGQSSYARKAILMHDGLLKQRDAAVMQEQRDYNAICHLADLIRLIYLYPKEATDRIQEAFDFDDEIQDWYRRDELEGKGLQWFIHRTRYVVASKP